MKNSFFSWGIFLAFFCLSGCIHPLSKEARESVDPDARFELARKNPKAYLGKTFLLGGAIVNNISARQGSSLEILSYDLSSQGRPNRPNEIKGRFLAVSKDFLDPALYKNDELVTLTGTLRGEEKHTLNGADYIYPVFEIGEIYLWEKRQDRYYRPHYYPYPYYPYYYYPYYPYHPYYPFRRHPYYWH